VCPVVVQPWVIADVFRAVSNDRYLLDLILFDLNHRLPKHLSRYQSKRIVGSPRCFWYERDYSLDPHSFKLRRLRFVVRDSDSSVLEVIWVMVVA
jgi:hypothetical protein